MKILKIILWIVALLAVALIAYLYYMGFFTVLKVTEREVGPYTLVYEDHIGPYQDTGPVVAKLDGELRKDGVQATDGFGIYLDDPSKVAAAKLRSQVGLVVTDQDLRKLMMSSKKYKTMKWPKTSAIVTEFPIKNNLSYMFGPMKAYPVLMKYMAEKKITPDQIGMCMEYYDMKGNKIIFMFQRKK